MVSPQFSLSPEVAIISMTFSRNLPKEHADVRVYCYIGTHNDTISLRLLTIFCLSLIYVRNPPCWICMMMVLHTFIVMIKLCANKLPAGGLSSIRMQNFRWAPRAYTCNAELKNGWSRRVAHSSKKIN